MEDTKQYGTSASRAPVMNRSPTSRPVPKVQAATIGSIIGGAIVTITVGILKRNDIVLEPEEVGALTALVGTILTFVLGYFTKPQGGMFGGDDPPDTGEFVGTSYDRRRDGGSPGSSGFAIMLAIFLPLSLAGGCMPMQGPMVSPFSAPATTPQEKMAFAELQFQGAMSTIDRLDKRGMLQDQATRSRLADLLVSTNLAMASAQQALKGGSPNQAALVSAADEAVWQLREWLREKEQAQR